MTRADRRFDTSSVPSRLRAPSSAAGRRAARTAAAQRRREELDLFDDLRGEVETEARTRTELLTFLSHDLRTPLSVMTINIYSLGRILPQDHAARRHLEMLKRNSDELRQMLDNTSEAARIGRGEVSLTLGREDVGELIQAAREVVRRHAEDRNVTLAVTIAEGVPRVLGAREKLLRLLGGLLSRAVRVSPKNGTVSIQAEPAEDGGVRISVTDEAVAIHERHAEAAFDLPRDELERRLVGSTFVLDLYVARGVVEAHGGRIWLEAGPGQGNTFVVELPDGDED